ncbi:winged helix-turn-helix transcriptional regulator [Natrinema sp. 74]|uniref:winged helix-turn-helix transcriptional regulator n=1 Tax=Natrinema sp. 74 TaxID=3384159 RepID=UPI0038D514FB
MASTPSVATRVVAIIVAAALLGGGVAGIAAGTSSGGSELADSSALSVGDSLNTTDGTTGTIENTTNETTDTLRETTDTVTNGVENTTGAVVGSNGSVGTAVNETTAVIDDTVSTTTDTVDATVDETTGTVGEPSNGTAVDASLETETAVGGQRSDAGGDSSDGAATADSTSDGDGGDGSDAGVAGTSGPTETATDAVLVGALGAITASGAAAGAAGGSGATSGASTATANWLGQFRTLRDLQRAGSALPWKILPLFRYSTYDDSDPLEHDRRRAVYEVIEREPGSYLSEVSNRTNIPLSTVRHHVRVLEDEGLVTGIKINGKRRYFRDADDAELRAALAEPAKRAVLETLADLGRAPNGRLADELGRDPSTVSHHLSALADDGLVVREKDGRSMVNELPARVAAALVDETASAADSAPAPADD